MDQPQKNHSQEAHFNVSAQRIARVYAEALYQAAAKQGLQDEVLEELSSLENDVLAKDARLDAMIAGAALGRTQRTAVLKKALAQRASPILFNFLLVLNDHERLDLLRPILAQYRQISDQKKGRVPVQVTAAVPVSDEQQRNISEQLRTKFNIEPVLKVKVDPGILGGLKVRIGDWQYDASVRSRLDTIRQLILARSSYEIQSGRNRFCSDS